MLTIPELPEVETVKLQLQKYLVEHKIEKVEVRNLKIFQGDKKNVVGAKIKRVGRFAKVLVIDLSSGYSLVIHIKLTGQLIYRGVNLKDAGRLSNKVTGGLGGNHTHVIFYLDKNSRLYYNDVRRFGWIKVVRSDKLQEISFIKNLGPEPLTDVTNSELGKLTLSKFITVVQSTGRAIKVLLMDQSKIAGVGNIYANDALWEAKIRPDRKAKALSEQEIRLLHKSIEKVLKKGLKWGGASELAFVTPDGQEGEYQKHFVAYGRDGKICPRCKKAKFKKVTLSGRGTYFCPNCQK